MCQSNGSCGGGSNVAQNTPCDSNRKYCDGSGTCKCRAKSSWNKLTNPGFDGGATGWTLNGTASYKTTDVDGCSGSGSVNVNSLGATFHQCLPASPNQIYYFGYRFKASGGPSSSGTATCDISFLPTGTTCETGVASSGEVALGTYNNDNWILASAIITSDPDAAHVVFNCSGPAASGNYDQLYLSTSSPGSPPF
jgi:hypothetical protein